MYMGDSNQLATLQLAVECFNHSATSHHTGQIVKDKVIMSCKTQRIQRAHNILTDCLCIVNQNHRRMGCKHFQHATLCIHCMNSYKEKEEI